jgi:UDP-N-acetylmuramoylalanine--D-glutamate ligase
MTAIDLEGIALDSFIGRRVAVLGLARTGVALCRFLVDRGAQVTAYDRRAASQLRTEVEDLSGRSVRLLVGPDVDPANALTDQELICTSPSINSSYPTTEPRLAAALRAIERQGRIPVVSESELFLRLSPALSIGVTGTKGKTTTAHLIAAVLAKGDKPVLLGGNTGTPLIEKVPELTADHRVVLELSELQLATLTRGTAVSVYTNVTIDHLDRHGSIGAYQDVKRRLAELAPPDGILVLNGDDPVSSGFGAVPRARAVRAVRYRLRAPGRGGVSVRHGWVVANTAQRRVMPLDEIPLRGQHNVVNVLAAVSVGLLFDIPTDRIRRAIAAFQPLENRLEPVLRVDDVLFINDTQATQPDATIAALRSFDPPIVLICGGTDKGLPLDRVATEIAARAFAVVVMGETGPQLSRLVEAAGGHRVESVSDMDGAVGRAFDLAHDARAATGASQATVLLSPAAAGYELLTPYSVRGAEFKDAVLTLAATTQTSESAAARCARPRPRAAPARSAG